MVETALERSDLEALLGVSPSWPLFGRWRIFGPTPSRRCRPWSRPTIPAWNEVDPVTGEIAAEIPLEFEQSIGDRMPHLTAVFAAHVDEHPVIAEYRRTGNGRPQAISDFVSAEAFHATTLYQDFYAVFGTEDQMSFVLPAPDVTIGITVDRPDRSFKARDREILNLLRPHLIQAYRNALALEAARAALEAVDSLAEASGDGVIVLDRTGKIVHSTPAACTLLERHFSGHPPTGLPAELADYVARTASQSAPAWPMMQDGLVVRRLCSAGTTVLVLGLAGGAPAPAALRELGLTPREAEVLSHISMGSSTKETAARLEISPRTVDKHVERSLAKLGVDSRLAAANLINQIAP